MHWIPSLRRRRSLFHGSEPISLALGGIHASICLVKWALRYTKHAPLCYESLVPIAQRFNVDFRARRRTLALYESLQMLAREASVYKVFDVVKAACFVLSKTVL